VSLLKNCSNLAQKTEAVFYEDLKFSLEIWDIFVEFHPEKKALKSKLRNDIVLMTQFEVGLLQEIILDRYNIYNTINQLNEQRLKNKLTLLYSNVQLIHPIECVKIEALLYGLKKLKFQISHVDQCILQGFNEISTLKTQANTENVQLALVQMSKLSKLNSKVLQKIQKLEQKFDHANHKSK